MNLRDPGARTAYLSAKRRRRFHPERERAVRAVEPIDVGLIAG